MAHTDKSPVLIGVTAMSIENADDRLGPETQFLSDLDDLGAVLWLGAVSEYGDAECSRPPEWQKLTRDENQARISRWHGEYAPFVCVNTGIPVAVFDSDTKNGGDPEKVRALLIEKRERIYAEIFTPSGGKHYYIKGHPDLPTVHSKADDPKLPDFPGLDIQSHGANVFAPGTLRPKYGGTGYDDRLQRTQPDAGDRQRRRPTRAHRVGGRAVGAQC